LAVLACDLTGGGLVIKPNRGSRVSWHARAKRTRPDTPFGNTSGIEGIILSREVGFETLWCSSGVDAAFVHLAVASGAPPWRAQALRNHGGYADFDGRAGLTVAVRPLTYDNEPHVSAGALAYGVGSTTALASRQLTPSYAQFYSVTLGDETHRETTGTSNLPA
jgi:hypothetical protein